MDAVEGYLMAFRRELVEGGLGFDEKFRFYRTADIEYSFRVKQAGRKAMVVPVPVERHEHRMWFNTPPAERAKWSKRNYYRFLDRFRGRFDLLVGGEPPETRCPEGSTLDGNRHPIGPGILTRCWSRWPPPPWASRWCSPSFILRPVTRSTSCLRASRRARRAAPRTAPWSRSRDAPSPADELR